MSKSIPVTDGTNVIYTIELKKDFGDLCKELTRLKISPDQKLCIVTDSNVAPLYAKEVQDQLSAVFSNVFLHIFPAGEASKNTDTVGALYQFLIENHFDRRDILLALGGGVVGDLTGFTAATTYGALISYRFQLHCFHRWTAVLAAKRALILCSIKIWSVHFISLN